MVLGLKWRMAVYQAKALKQLNDGQYGSRPQRNAIDPVMLEELQLELSRATRRTLIQTNYDAASCYDLIIPNFAMLASRQFGFTNRQRSLMHAPYTQRNITSEQSWVCHLQVITTRKKCQFMGLVKGVGTLQ